jgi:serine/threonine-protein kinase 24/25/MST4
MLIVDSQDDIDDIRQEIAIQSELDSPCVTKYFTSFVCKTSLWIVMEYCSGGSCLDLVNSLCRSWNYNVECVNS